MTPQAEPDTTPLEILKTGACSPSCLLSGASGRCNCRCRGAYHGVLLATLTRAQQAAA